MRGTKADPGRQVRQKAGLNRSLLDVAFGEIARQLRYKADWQGLTTVEIVPWYPSSKTCSGCGHVLDELRLDQRTGYCPKCGRTHDRDLNAAVNIEREGLRQLAGATPAG